MSRIHTQNSFWDNPNQTVQGNSDPSLGRNPKHPSARSGNHEDFVPQQQMQRQMEQQISTRFTVPQDYNVLTRLVSEYDADNVTVAKTIVQPIALVPYNTTEQPLYQYAPDNSYGGQQGYSDQGYDYNGYDDNYGQYDSYDDGHVRKNTKNRSGKKSVRGVKILFLLLSLIGIAVIVLGKFIDLVYLKFDTTRSGLEILLGVTTVISGGLAIKEMLIPILLAANALFTLLIFLDGLFGNKRGVSIIEKIIAILSLLCIGGFGYLIYDGGLGLGYGVYIAAGCSALIAIFALLSKKRR